MVYSTRFFQKAKSFCITVQQPKDALRVCKFWLEQLLWKLDVEHDKLIASLADLKSGLLEIVNMLENMQQARLESLFMQNRYISSLDGIIRSVRQAYDSIRRNEFFPCKDAIKEALQYFFIN